MRTALFLVLFVCVCHPTASGGEETGTLHGLVVSADEHQPVPGAAVLLQGTLRGTLTSASGEFSIPGIPPGRYVVVISMIGYRPYRSDSIEIPAGGDLRLPVSLEASAVETAPVVISASRREQFAEEAPVSISVIDRQALEERQSVTVDDALQYIPGVNITESQVNIRGSTGYSHGAGSRVLVLVDGLPVLGGDNGEIEWETIPVANIDHVEVVKGAGSALYGSSALGGVINIITRQPTGSLTTIRTFGGGYVLPSYSSWHWTDDPRTSGGVMVDRQDRFGSVTAEVGASRNVDDSYKVNDYWKRWNLWGHLGVEISPFESIGLDASFLDQQRGNFLYWKSLDDALQPTDDQIGEHVNSDRWRLSLNYTRMISHDCFLTARGGWFHSRWADNIPTMFDSGGSRSTSDAATAEVQVNAQFTPGNILTGGISGSSTTVDADTIFGHHSSTGFALFLQDEYALLRDVHLTAGVRWDAEKIAAVDLFSRVNPKFGLVCTPDDATTLRLSVASGFRIPSIAEIFTTTEAGGLLILPDSALQPERSWSYEVGGSRHWSGGVTADLSLFRTDLWDLIEPSIGTDGYIRFQNITRAQVTGVEASLTLDPWAGILPVTVSYTYVDPEDKTANDVLRYRPRNVFYASVHANLRPVFIGVDYRYLSKVERIDEELITLGIVKDGDARVPISVFDLNAGIDWMMGGTAMSGGIHIRNLLRYYYTDFIGDLGPPQSIVASLQARIP